MRKIYKFFSLVLSMLILSAVCFVVPANAAPVINGQKVYLKTDTVSVKSGDTVTVEVMGKSGVSFTNVEFSLTYNTDLFTLVYDATKWGTAYSGTDVGTLADDFAAINTATAGTVKFAFATYPSGNISNDGSFLKLVLKVKDGLVAAGKTSGNVALSVIKYNCNANAVYSDGIPSARLTFNVTHTCSCSGDWEITEQPTCTKAGHAVKKCDQCSKIIDEKNLDKLAHKYALDSKNSKNATCTEDGNNHYVCSDCGDSYDEPVKATGHSFSEWKAVSGKKDWYSSVCTNCNENKLSYAPEKLENSSKDVTAKFDKGTFFKEVKLTANTVSSSAEKLIKAKIPEGYEIIKMTDVSFLDGNTEVEPAINKPVIIGMNVKYENIKNVKILHFKNNNLEELNIVSYSSDNIDFTAESLSPIIIVEKKNGSAGNASSSTVTKTTDSAVAPTGDNTNIYIPFFVAFVAVFLLLAARRKKI